jgi:hypothetical protein
MDYLSVGSRRCSSIGKRRVRMRVIRQHMRCVDDRAVLVSRIVPIINTQQVRKAAHRTVRMLPIDIRSVFL